MTTKVKQLANNQFIITDDNKNQYFQSCDSIIAKIPEVIDSSGNRYSLSKIILDKKYWNYSKTTRKYRNQFLGEKTKETQAKIDSGEYILTDLNQ